MVGAEDPLIVGEHLLEERARFRDPAGLAISEGEVRACSQCVRVVGAEDPLAVGERLLEERARFRDPAGLAVRDREVRACSQRIRVVGAEDRSLSASTCSKSALASATRAAWPYEIARFARAASVSAWSGPRTRSLSASTCS